MEIDLEAVISMVINAIAVCFLAYLKKDLRNAKEEIKRHNETSIKNANGTLTHAVKALPTPCYIKRLKYSGGRPVMIYQQVNQLYADIFGLKAEDMINKTDLESGVPREVANKSHAKDIEAWSTGHKLLYLKEIGNNRAIKFELIPMKDTDNVMGFEIGKHCEDAEKLMKNQI